MNKSEDNHLMDKISELNDGIKSFENKYVKIENDLKKRTGIILIVIAICAGLSIFLLTNNYLQPKTEIGHGLSSNYEIQGLKGDMIKTWITWYIIPTDLFHIHVEASPLVTDERMKVIRDVIFSNETVTANGQTYYKGWEGALQEASHRGTKIPLPVDLHTIQTDTGTGNIVIELTNLENPDGFSAYTKSIADAGQHQILKSKITIYQVDKLTDTQLATILRHELGHGFGLSHSTDPLDLMAPKIITDIPYISECDIEGLVELYNGDKKSHVVCKI